MAGVFDPPPESAAAGYAAATIRPATSATSQDTVAARPCHQERLTMHSPFGVARVADAPRTAAAIGCAAEATGPYPDSEARQSPEIPTKW